MTHKTIKEIADTAELSAFYVSADSHWWRVDFTNQDQGCIGIRDEDTGDECTVSFEEIQSTGGTLWGIVQLL